MKNTAGKPPSSTTIAERDLPEVPFRDFLDAKYDLDSRSLNRGVRTRFLSETRKRTSPGSGPLRILDAGTGTGATLRRLLTWMPDRPLEFLGIDLDAANLAETASAYCRENPEGPDAGEYRSHRIDFLEADLLSFSLPPQTDLLHCVTAHALLDLLPPERTLTAVAALLQPGGLFYTTLNYRGETAFSPRYRDRGYERDLLSWYDATMDERLLDGEPVGGSRTGRLLRGTAERCGFTVLAEGASDWRIRPRRSRYLPGDERVLHAMLGFIRKEGERRIGLAGPHLERWLRDRLDRIGEGGLALRVTHNDLLARRNDP